MTTRDRSCTGFARTMRARSSRVLIVSLLLLALPAYGLAGLITELLGAQHRHAEVRVVDGSLIGWQDFRRGTGSLRPLQPHRHSSWTRHHHSSDDATVVALDATDHETSAGDGASILISASTLATSSSTTIVVSPDESTFAWPPCGPDRVATLAVAPLDRPPKA